MICVPFLHLHLYNHIVVFHFINPNRRSSNTLVFTNKNMTKQLFTKKCLCFAPVWDCAVVCPKASYPDTGYLLATDYFLYEGDNIAGPLGQLQILHRFS